jgi:hypothetical protein
MERLRRVARPWSRLPAFRAAKLFHALGIALMGIVWIAALTGLVVVAIRPLGG